MDGRLHTYHSKRNLTLFEFINLPSSGIHATTVSPNVLLFVGGMYDNYGSPGYVATLGALFPRHQDQKWSVFHIQLTSAGRFFGIVDVNRDIDEIATGVTFIREKLRAGKSTNIVLMGHSTGCQDTVHYLHSSNPTPPEEQSPSETNTYKPSLRPNVQGAILQAPVSDREALVHEINTNKEATSSYEKLTTIIDQTPVHEHTTTILPMHLTKPLFGPIPTSIRRFLDLTSPGSPQNPSKEDLLSSDLPEQVLNRTFGNIGANNILIPATTTTTTTTTATSPTPPQPAPPSSLTNHSPNQPQKSILILISSIDEYYTPTTSTKKPEFLTKWAAALQSNPHPENQVHLHAESKCIPNATHDVSGESPASRRARLVDLRGAVLRYINDVIGGVDEIAWEIFRRDEDGIIDAERDGGDAEVVDDKSRL